jgi:hypothetical protein
VASSIAALAAVDQFLEFLNVWSSRSTQIGFFSVSAAHSTDQIIEQQVAKLPVKEREERATLVKERNAARAARAPKPKGKQKAGQRSGGTAAPAPTTATGNAVIVLDSDDEEDRGDIIQVSTHPPGMTSQRSPPRSVWGGFQQWFTHHGSGGSSGDASSCSARSGEDAGGSSGWFSQKPTPVASGGRRLCELSRACTKRPGHLGLCTS